MEEMKKLCVTQLNLGNWPVDGLEYLGKCPVCGGAERVLMYEGLTDRVYKCAPGMWQLFGCDKCGSAYLDPRPNPETIGLAYSEYFTHSVSSTATQLNSSNKWAYFRQSLRNDYLNERYNTNLFPAHRLGRLLLPLIPLLSERADRWVRHLPPSRPGSRLLEIGCGNGNFLIAMRELGWEVQGIEPDAKAAQVARKHDLHIVDGVLRADTFSDASFDAITLHHVIEHLHNPIEILQICFRLLRPVGTISIITPNFSSRGNQIFGRDWYPLDPPRHLVLFTTRSLIATMSRTGYRKVTAHASFFDAESIFRASEKLKADSNGLTNSIVSDKSGIGVHVSNLIDSFNPHVSEEVVVSARKPG